MVVICNKTKSMKKTLLVFSVVLGAYTSLCAQQNTVSAGDSFSEPGGSASISIGQIDYVSSGTSTTVSEGVQQTFDIKQNGTSIASEQGVYFNVFPNPTQDWIHIHVADLKETYSLSLFDANGRKLIQEQALLENHTISMAQMASGMYIVQIYDQKKPIHSIQIIKN